MVQNVIFINKEIKTISWLLKSKISIVCDIFFYQTRMTSFIKANIKKSDGLKNFDRLAANKIVENIISEQNFDLLRH